MTYIQNSVFEFYNSKHFKIAKIQSWFNGRKTSIERGASSSPLGGTLSQSDKSDPGPSPRAHEHGRQHRANIPRLYFEQNKRNWGPTRRQWVLELIVYVLIYSPRVCSFRVSCRLWSLWWVLGRRLETQWTLPWALLYLLKDVSCCRVIVSHIWYRFSLFLLSFFLIHVIETGCEGSVISSIHPLLRF